MINQHHSYHYVGCNHGQVPLITRQETLRIKSYVVTLDTNTFEQLSYESQIFMALKMGPVCPKNWMVLLFSAIKLEGKEGHF